MGDAPGKLTWWWVESAAFACAIATHNYVIVKTPPILVRFRGQRLRNLIRWAAVEHIEPLDD